MRCDRPPEGWWCSRVAGHDGPCAARPIDEGRCPICGAGPHGRCRLEGEGECPEGCVTPEQW